MMMMMVMRERAIKIINSFCIVKSKVFSSKDTTRPTTQLQLQFCFHSSRMRLEFSLVLPPPPPPTNG